MNRGRDVQQVLTMQIWLPEPKYPSPQQLTNFFEQLLPRVRVLPGVESASVVNYPPLGLLGTGVPVEGQMKRDSRDAPLVHALSALRCLFVPAPKIRRSGKSLAKSEALGLSALSLSVG